MLYFYYDDSDIIMYLKEIYLVYLIIKPFFCVKYHALTALYCSDYSVMFYKFCQNPEHKCRLQIRQTIKKQQQQQQQFI